MMKICEEFTFIILNDLPFSNMMKVFTPLAGEPYSVEEVHEILEEISRTNAKQKEMRDAIARKRPA